MWKEREENNNYKKKMYNKNYDYLINEYLN